MCPLGGSEVFSILENHPVRITLDSFVDKVEDVGLRPAVQLSLDLLRISVLCQLLPRLINKEKQAVLFRVLHLKLLSTELTHILCGDVRSHKEGLPSASAVDLLEGNSEVILQGEKQRCQEQAQKRKQTLFGGKCKAELASHSRLRLVQMFSHTTQLLPGKILICTWTVAETMAGTELPHVNSLQRETTGSPASPGFHLSKSIIKPAAEEILTKSVNQIQSWDFSQLEK